MLFKKNNKFQKKEYKKTYTKESLYSYALFLLSKREYSIKKLTDKLLTKIEEEQKEIVDEIINKLIEYNYISDERKAKSILRNYSQKESGEKLKQRLKLAGINKEVIDEIDLLEDPEILKEKGLKLLKSKYKNYDTNNVDKYIRFLLNKGFTYSVVKDIINLFKEPINEL